MKPLLPLALGLAVLAALASAPAASACHPPPLCGNGTGCNIDIPPAGCEWDNPPFGVVPWVESCAGWITPSYVLGIALWGAATADEVVFGC